MTERDQIPGGGFVPDSADGPDLLGVDREVTSIAALIASRQVAPPLCVGIFGTDGAGVSFFLRRLAQRVDHFSAIARPGDRPDHCACVQVTYNPWHYVGANQWLALAERIFQSLHGAMAGGHPDANARARLLDAIGTGGKLQRELASRREAAQRLASIEEFALERAQTQHDEAVKQHALNVSQSRWAEVSAVFAERVGADGAAVDIDRAGTMLGLTGLSRNAEALHKVLDEAKTLGGRASLLNSTVTAQRHIGNAFLVFVVVLLVAAGAWVLTTLYGDMKDVGSWVETVQNALGVIGTVGTFFIVVGALLLRNRAAGAIETLQRHGGRLDAVIGEIDRRRNYEAVVARQREVTLQRQVEECRTRVAEAFRQLGLAEQAIAEMHDRGVQQGVSETYRDLISNRLDGQPGSSIVPMIREDFEVLSALLARHHEADDAQRPERIIIYIDDLDQCPPAAVADVIQAIQLLLAFPIFVVVIGADPAWLMTALDGHYAMTPEGPVARSIRTLSKFIQIPFWMQPLTSDGASRLVREMFRRSPLPGPAVAEPSGLIAPATIETAAEPRSPDAPAIAAVTDAEVAYVEEVAGLLSDSLRDVKRLANCYRILRATVRDDRLAALIVDAEQAPSYPAAITQLAILIAAPFSARRYVELLHVAHDVDDLIRAVGDDPGVHPAELRAIQALLDTYRRWPAGPSDIDRLRAWLEVAARHSFTVPPALAVRAAHVST